MNFLTDKRNVSITKKIFNISRYDAVFLFLLYSPPKSGNELNIEEDTVFFSYLTSSLFTLFSLVNISSMYSTNDNYS